MLTLNFVFMLITSLLQSGQAPPVNVLGTNLEACCYKPMTGFYRDGFCNTGPQDYGSHTVCVILTEEFLSFSSSCGNDLVTPNPRYGFPGLKPGDQWCLCAVRWKEAEEAGMACQVILESTHIAALQVIELDVLKKYAVTSTN